MPAYAVLEPPRRNRSVSDHADRFVFLRERFSLWAFLFGPLWMIWRRLWVVLIIYLVVVGLIGYGLLRLEIARPVIATVYLLIQWLVGLEATGLRRWTRLRRGWRDCGVVIADDLESAERRFFDAKAARRPLANLAETPAPLATPQRDPLRPDITGLFPEPGGGR
jgi:small-conductance mechanosensitive channel